MLLFLFARILAEGARALSVTLSGGALFCELKTIPIPVKFDRQGHLANLMGFRPNCCLLSEYFLLTVLVASPAFWQPDLCFRSQLADAIEREWYALVVQIFHEYWSRVHTFSTFWLWPSVVSLFINVTTDMSPTGDLLVASIFVTDNALLSLLRSF